MTDHAAATPKRWVIDTRKPAPAHAGTCWQGDSYDDAGNLLPRAEQPTPHAAATLANLRATIRSFAQQPMPDWDALIAEQDAIEAARLASQPPFDPAAFFDTMRRFMGHGVQPIDSPAAPPTAATAMPARALHHTRRTGWEQLR